MNKRTEGVLFGFAFFLAVGFVIGIKVGQRTAYTDDQKALLELATYAIQECEEVLPRYKYCVPSAVPEEGLYGDDY